MTLKELLSWSVIWIFAVSMLLFVMLAEEAHGAHTEKPEVFPDVLVSFGCLDEQVALNLQEVWEVKGNYWFREVASQYGETGECFFLEYGYPAYVDRVVKKADKDFEGENAYVVEAHFWGAPPGKTFFFMYYGELPVRARRSAA